MERDEAYVPKTRTDLGIPTDATPSDLAEFFEDAPLYNLVLLIRQQIFAFDAYLRKSTPLYWLSSHRSHVPSVQCFGTDEVS